MDVWSGGSADKHDRKSVGPLAADLVNFLLFPGQLRAHIYISTYMLRTDMMIQPLL